MKVMYELTSGLRDGWCAITCEEVALRMHREAAKSIKET